MLFSRNVFIAASAIVPATFARLDARAAGARPTVSTIPAASSVPATTTAAYCSAVQACIASSTPSGSPASQVGLTGLCSTSSDCKYNLICAAPSLGAAKQCLAQIPNGADCSPDNTFNFVTAACASGCFPAKLTGVDVGRLHGKAYCGGQAADAYACTQSTQCLSNVCKFTGSTGFCGLKFLGGSCQRDADCASGKCNTVCTTSGQGVSCSSTGCGGLQPNGAYCTASTDCTSGICDATNTCNASLSPVGTVCTSNAQCASGNCYVNSNVCLPAGVSSPL